MTNLPKDEEELTCLTSTLNKRNRPGSDAALPNLKKSRRVSIAGGDRKKGGFSFIYPSNTFPIKEMF
jgi:hypothetical protein